MTDEGNALLRAIREEHQVKNPADLKVGDSIQRLTGDKRDKWSEVESVTYESHTNTYLVVLIPDTNIYTLLKESVEDGGRWRLNCEAGVEFDVNNFDLDAYNEAQVTA